jgi:hypothetical protein
MAQDNEYRDVIVESFEPSDRSGRHGAVHVRPMAGQGFDIQLFVECSKKLMDRALYPVGTKFKLRVKLTDRQGGGEFLCSHYSWKAEVLGDKDAAAFIKGSGKR